MKRRTVLSRLGAVAATAALAGCSQTALEEAERSPPFLDGRAHPADVDLPVQQRLGVAAREIDRTAAEGIASPDEFETTLGDRGLSVETVEAHEVAGEPVLSLEYVPTASDDQRVMRGLGVVAGGYAALVSAGHDSERVEATLRDDSGEPFGEFVVEHTWASEYAAGELTARRYADEIAVGLGST